jgi:biopolymer transport protein TolQ
MNPEPSLWSFVVNAGPVVKTVLCLLFCASIISWTLIIQRALLFRKNEQAMASFEHLFWSGADFNRLYHQISQHAQSATGSAAIFHAGFKEFRRLIDTTRLNHVPVDTVIDAVKRAMRIVHSREVARLEQSLPFLATVGSISPYVGLFGTVWGIMTSFRALGAVQQASIAMVAPGISEALIATAVGLFAAIPAVIAYNRFSHRLERSIQQAETFQEEFIGILQRNLLAKESHAAVV